MINSGALASAEMEEEANRRRRSRKLTVLEELLSCRQRLALAASLSRSLGQHSPLSILPGAGELHEQIGRHICGHRPAHRQACLRAMLAACGETRFGEPDAGSLAALLAQVSTDDVSNTVALIDRVYAPASLTPLERRALRATVARRVVRSLATGLSQAAWVAAHRRLVGFDFSAEAEMQKQLVGLATLGGLLLGPAVGSLSDAVGRRPVLVLQAIGRAVWRAELLRLLPPGDSSTASRHVEMGLLCLGLLTAGAPAVEAAAHDDIFGTRPVTSARIRLQSTVWSGCSWAMTAILARLLLSAKLASTGQLATIAAVVGSLELPLLLLVSASETLPRSKRPRLSRVQVAPLQGFWGLLRRSSTRRLAVVDLLCRATGDGGLDFDCVGFVGTSSAVVTTTTDALASVGYTLAGLVLGHVGLGWPLLCWASKSFLANLTAATVPMFGGLLALPAVATNGIATSAVATGVGMGASAAQTAAARAALVDTVVADAHMHGGFGNSRQLSVQKLSGLGHLHASVGAAANLLTLITLAIGFWQRTASSSWSRIIVISCVLTYRRQDLVSK
eukprot:SAG31_NODE_3137_length_4632_cov_3.575871_4_plen_562_part_00